MKRNRLNGPRAFVAFTATVLLAVAATAMNLVPDEAVQAADSLVNIPAHLEQILPGDPINP
ncbi:hypothetical protein M4R22_16555 [Acidovorax sp. GBBC 3334]|uniref:Uncharacterized protein n=1 Tax=Paracidovorax konjaci TaxID=32040 RepID=A0A1I1WL04_9BURK|nr:MULTISPECIES: hypothetical protein [Comamonadaceae]MDA8456376.1 hypothetical protein [Acidovorax sp. GBBC 3334]MDA8520271.1 hypothetical protein [Acidovorax sp. NCPPB 4044]SFD95752.1 hypothetical protein SAMN04489710_11036 [Paracidovorax konjaci]